MRFTLMLLLVASCSPEPDGGPCGIQGGPNGTNALTYLPGADASKALQIQLGPGGPNDCGSPNLFWLAVDGTLKAAGTPRLDTNAVKLVETKADQTAIYEYLGQSFSLSRNKAAGVDVVIGSLRRKCTTPDGKTVSCQ